ncbi:MAG: hypothetical protein RRA94_03100 [Bacteroidota bacterium]|nr:hypothetical protein [Bacteroidota bacterium]
MDIMTLNELKPLAERHEEPCVSLYMPTHRSWAEAQQDPIRFRNLLKKAESEIATLYPDDDVAMELVEQARGLEDDNDFWRHQSDGLALFFSPDYFDTYRVALPFAEEVVVGQRFHVKPLLPVFTGDGRFYILAVSQNKVRLLTGSRTSVEEIHPEGLPENLADALGHEYSSRHLQYHTGAAGGAGQRNAVFHGQESDGYGKDMILRYFHQIDSGLRRALGQEQAPLVLASVDYLMAIYEEANSYPHLLEAGIKGNPDDIKPKELHARAWEIVAPWYQQKREKAVQRFQALSGTEKVSDDITQVLPDAYFGRVDTLFVAEGEHVPGVFSPRNGEVLRTETASKDSEDLLNAAAVHALLNGGLVFALPKKELPSGSECAAIYRY